MKYEIRRKLPSAKITKKLISDICNEIKTHIIRAGDNFSGIKIDIKDADGEATIADISEFDKDKFFNGTKEIRVMYFGKSYPKEDVFSEVYISFYRRVLESDVRVKCYGPNAKSSAMGLAEEIRNIVRQESNVVSVFYSPSPIWILAATFAMIAIYYSTKGLIDERISLLLSFSPYIYMVYVACGLIFPYATFDTKKNEELDSVRKWVIYGCFGAIIFGFIGYIIYRK